MPRALRPCPLAMMLAAALVGASACVIKHAEPFPSPASFCEEKAEQECQVAARCGVTMAACVQARAGLCSRHASDASLAGRAYASQLVDDCLNKVSVLYANANPITPKQLADVDDVCERVFAGTSTAGMACTTSYACANGGVCDKMVCASPSPKTLGQFCANPGEVCTGESFCSGVSPAQCLATRAQGEACGAAARCATGLRCVNALCAPALHSGEACTSSAECDASPGAGAPYCDPNAGKATPVCTAGLVFAPGSVALCAQYGG